MSVDRPGCKLQLGWLAEAYDHVVVILVCYEVEALLSEKGTLTLSVDISVEASSPVLMLSGENKDRSFLVCLF